MVMNKNCRRKTVERLKERYLIDEQGKRVAVVLDIQDYERLMETLEELESIHAYDVAKAANDEVVPLEIAIAEIEQNHEL
jgi:prevent-host-death family protein